mgnify:CR=1 FL=1
MTIRRLWPQSLVGQVILLVALALQISLGLSNVIFHLPLLVAVMAIARSNPDRPMMRPSS